MHIDPMTLDALAYDMAEDAVRKEAELHVAQCSTCQHDLRLRQEEASLLKRTLAPSMRHKWRRVTALATAAAACLIAGWFILATPHGDPLGPPDTSGIYRFNDGSEVVASCAPESAGWRVARLAPGDYFFNVRPSDARKFRIVTGAGEVQVLGTSFRVQYGEKIMNGKMTAFLGVAVVTGAVVLLNNRGSVTLGPDEAAEVVGDHAPVAMTPSDSPRLMGESPQARIVHLEQELASARRELARFKAAPSAGGSTPEETNAIPAPPDEQAQGRARIVQLLRSTYTGMATMADMVGLGEALKDTKLVESLRADLQKRIDADGTDAEARLAIARIEAARLHTERVSVTERAQIMARAAEQIDAVLENDPENWEALYQKGVGTSHSARSPAERAEAVRQLESLRVLQETRRPEPRFVSTYAELARVHLAERDSAKAVAVLEAGLELFADDEKLKELLSKLRK